MPYDSISLALIERGLPTLHIWFARAEYLEDELEKCVRNGNQGRPLLVIPSLGDNAPELLSQKAVSFDGRRPGAFHQRTPQPRIAARRTTALVFACRAIVSRAKSSPRAEMFARRKRRHITTRLGQNRRRARFPNRRHSFRTRISTLAGECADYARRRAAGSCCWPGNSHRPR